MTKNSFLGMVCIPSSMILSACAIGALSKDVQKKRKPFEARQEITCQYRASHKEDIEQAIRSTLSVMTKGLATFMDATIAYAGYGASMIARDPLLRAVGGKVVVSSFDAIVHTEHSNAIYK